MDYYLFTVEGRLIFTNFLQSIVLLYLLYHHLKKT